MSSESDLRRRIERAQKAHAPQTPDSSGSTKPMARGLAMASEFVCAILVGAGLGWGVSMFTPVPAAFGMIGGTLLGLYAGVRMMVRRGPGQPDAKNLDPS